MTRSLILRVFLMLTSAPALSAEIGEITMTSMHVIYINGPILSGDTDKFSFLVSNTKNKSSSDKKPIFIDLESPGGSVLEAKQIAMIINEGKYPVSVAKKSECASACFIIFLASPFKFAQHGARIGVHSVSIDGKETAETKETTVDFARYAKDSGAPNSVVGKLVSTKPNDIVFLSDDELKSMGVNYVEDEIEITPLPRENVNPDQNALRSAPYSVTNDPEAEKRRAEFIAEQDQNFIKYWKQILQWSKAQHGGRIAAEKRGNGDTSAIVVAYFDRSQRYVEAWKYNDTSNGPGRKLVCRQNQYRSQLTCTDWCDGHEFTINYTHQIGADMVGSNEDFFDIFK